MIELKINGVMLPVPEGLSFTRSFETTIFNREKAVTDFTYPVDFPLTDEVIRALGFVNNLSTPIIQRNFLAEFYLHGSYVDTVTLNILNIPVGKKVMTANISGLYGTFASLMGDKMLNELAFDGIRNVGTIDTFSEGYSIGLNNSHVANVSYTRCSTATHMTDVVKGIVTADYTFPVGIDMGNNLPNTHDGASINVLNGWDYFNDMFIDPVWAYIMDRWNSNDVTTNYRYWWVPMFYCHYILRKCFEEAGFSVTGNFFTDARFTRLLLYNTYAINRCITTFSQSGNDREYTIVHDATTIDPKNHVPQMKVIDFITELCKYLNLKMDIDIVNRTVAVNVFDKGVSDFAFVDLTAVVADEPEIVFEAQDFQTGFDFSFAFDAKDAASGAGAMDDINTLPFAGTISSIFSSFPASPVTGAICYIRTSDEYWQYDGNSWHPYASNQQGYKTGTGDSLVKVNTKCVPVKTVYRYGIEWIPSQTATGYTLCQNTCAQSEIGIAGKNLLYINHLKDTDDTLLPENAMGVTAKTDIIIQPHLANWFGFQGIISLQQYPYASGVNYSPSGFTAYTNALCLDWYNPEGYGIAQQLWKPFTDLVKGGILVKWVVVMDILRFINIDFNTNGIRIMGQNYICKKAEIVYPFPQVSSLWLVRI